MVHAAGAVMMWRRFSCHTLCLLVPVDHRLNTTVYLSIVVPSSHGYSMSQSSNTLKLVFEYDSEFTIFKWPPVVRSQSNRAALGCKELEIHIMDVQPTNLQQLWDVIMSIWTKISEECFQLLVESVPRRIRAVLKAK